MKHLKLFLTICILLICTLYFGYCNNGSHNISLGRSNTENTSDFTLWQLQSTSNTIGMSYIFKMNNGEVAVLDGGYPLTKNNDAKKLIAKLSSLGNHVNAWFISHPHPDHAGALYSILQNKKGLMNGLKIDTIYYSKLTSNLIPNSPWYKKFYDVLDNSNVPKVNFTQPGRVITLDKTHFRILSVRNPDITKGAVNNSSMAIRVWDKKKSMVFLGDLQSLGANKLLKGPYKKYLDCDYIQMAHHGQGANPNFYCSIKFKYCLWPTPSWLWNNNVGDGFNTGPYKTVIYRNLMDSLGVKKNYVAWMGTVKIR